MRYIYLLLISCLLASCGLNQSKKTDNNSLQMNDSIVDPVKLAQVKLTNSNQYRELLEQLDQGNLASLDIAGTLFKNCVADSITRDSMFVIFNDFYNRLAGSYLENNESVSSKLENSPSAEVISQLKSSLLPYGILLIKSSEGGYYLEPQSEYLLQNFGTALSVAYREFLTLVRKEQNGRFAVDGKILIPPDSLTSRIITWESFMTRYPDFIAQKLVQEQYAQYLGAYLAGMDNTRIFDAETNRLNDSLKVSFESFVVKYPGSKSAEVVNTYLDLLKSTNFNYTDRVDSFLLEKVYR